MDNFFDNLQEKWLAWRQRNSGEYFQAVVEALFTPATPGDQSIGALIWESVDRPVMRRIEPGVKEKRGYFLAEAYRSWGGVLRLAVRTCQEPLSSRTGLSLQRRQRPSRPLWATEGGLPPEYYLRGHELGVMLCLAATETETNGRIKASEFLKLYKKFASRHWLAVACREEIARMLDMAGKGFFDAIVAYKYDRIGRSFVEAVRSIGELERFYNVAVYSATEPSEPLVRNILLSVAEDFSRQLSARMHDTMTSNAGEGFHNGGAPPYGYIAVKTPFC